MTSTFPVHVCSLDQVRELDVSTYDGIITIEDTTIKEPFRVQTDEPKQLILRFDDINQPMDDYVIPQMSHIKRALEFADKIEDGSLLVHCHAGISRSSAIALAVIAKRLGSGKEEEAVKTLEHVNPNCRPNKSIVEMTDELLERDWKLYKEVDEKMSFTKW